MKNGNEFDVGSVGSERDRALVQAAWFAAINDTQVHQHDDGTLDHSNGPCPISAIIAAVDAQHPAPALPRDVAMRIAESAAAWATEAGHLGAAWPGLRQYLAAIVSRHLPTDEEREAERAVVEAAARMVAAVEEDGFVFCWDEMKYHIRSAQERVSRLLAIRAHHGANRLLAKKGEK